MLKKSLDGLRRRLLRSRAKKIIIQEKLLPCFVRNISLKYPKVTIILFGSRAQNTQLPYSDYDIAVIFEKVDDRIRLIEDIRRMKPRGLPLDLIVLAKEELSDPIIARMFRKSKILYDGLGLREHLAAVSGNRSNI